MVERKSILFMLVFLAVLSVVYLILGKVNPGESRESFVCNMRSVEDGKEFDFTQLQGKRYVLQIFAPWCGYCAKEHSVLLSLKDEVPMYAIAWQTTPANVKTWLAVNGNPYKLVGTDTTGKCLSQLAIRGVPHTMVIDEEGKILFTGDSTTTREQILRYFN